MIIAAIMPAIAGLKYMFAVDAGGCVGSVVASGPASTTKAVCE
jgi:hypothetical protein